MVPDREGRLTWLLRFQTHSEACRETEGTSGPTSPPGGSSALPPPQAPTPSVLPAVLPSCSKLGSTQPPALTPRPPGDLTSSGCGSSPLS